MSKIDIVTPEMEVELLEQKLQEETQQEKLKRELKPGSKIISNTWKFPNLKPIKQDEKIRLYTI